MNAVLVNLCTLILLLGAVFLLLLKIKGRSSLDVLLDLEDQFVEPAPRLEQQTNSHSIRNPLQSFRDICEKSLQQNIIIRLPWFLPIILASAAFMLVAIIYGLNSPKLPLTGVVGLSIGYLIRNSVLRRSLENCSESIERSLPLIMEEMVMAVSAGHDVISAIKIILNNRKAVKISEPLTDIFTMVVRLSEGGLSFVDSLKQVGLIATVPSVKHALIHLSLAYQEGGELLMPLRELADSTQLMYQEKMEERVAKMPVRATMPLVLIFAGLIIFFVTTPMIQVMKVTAQGSNLNGAVK